MFCFQCQETARNQGCTIRGVCGKQGQTADLQDLLIFVCKGISVFGMMLEQQGSPVMPESRFICRALFTTVTNVGWEDEVIIERIEEGLRIRDLAREKAGADASGALPDCATWQPADREELLSKAGLEELRLTAEKNEDLRSLKALLVFGCKGIAAYAEHAAEQGQESDTVYSFLLEALESTTRDLSAEELVDMVMKAGKTAVDTMALLDQANTGTYGNPEITSINIGVGTNPGILVSGHDLRDLAELLEQTLGSGIDIYTHGEMLPANCYPALSRYPHLAGNYGSSWWTQNSEFESFNGPLLLTSNCLVPLKKDSTYLDRVFTTGPVNYPGARYIDDRPEGGRKDFSPLIEKARECPPPDELETGSIVAGFAHNQVLALADRVIEAVRSGDIRRFVVMAGCDGRHKTRDYFTEVARILPEDTVILTAGCAKYRYNKLGLGDIKGIPRVLDAGQCNDCYSLAVIALELQKAFELDDINQLPVSYDIAWYEQKAVAVLLALLHLGIKGLRLGPTLPGFLSPGVTKVLVEMFDIKPISTPAEDVEAMMEGR